MTHPAHDTSQVMIPRPSDQAIRKIIGTLYDLKKTSLKIVAVVLALAPNMAAAQSAVPDPSVPGSGYKIPETPRTSGQPLDANQVDPGRPGDGYRIAPAPRTSPEPLAADVQDSGIPGNGYQMRAPQERPAGEGK